MTANRGTIVVLLAWVLVAISLIALSFSNMVRMEVKAAINEVDLKQSQYIARSGVYYAINRVLLQALRPVTGDPASLPGTDEDLERGELRFSMADGTAEIAVTDETGKININLAPEDILRNLMLQAGLRQDEADTIVDSILDWRDPDPDAHPYGAEESYYQALPEPYHIKDGALDNIEELLLVNGVTPEVFYGQKFRDESGWQTTRGGLVKFLTTYTSVNRININSAPEEVLASIPGMDSGRVQAIIQQRQEKPFGAANDVGERIGPGTDTNTVAFLSAFRSNVFSIRSVARLNGRRVAATIRCTLGVDANSPAGYRMVYWNENNLEL